MIVSCIVAVSENGIIGKDNTLPWYLSKDLKYFKKKTSGHHIIMGRNCFESIGRPLPKRTNVVITRNPYYTVSNCLIAHSIQEALSIAYDNTEEEAFIIGGAQIYEQSYGLWDRLYLTRVHAHVEGDVSFPEINMDEWNMVSEEKHTKDEKNDHDFSFILYEK